MRRLFLVCSILFSLILMADTQPGVVRTIERPGRASVMLDGVMLRARGSHNAVMTNEDGMFRLLLPEVENGQAYALSSIIKSGYELQEKEIIGRRLAFSNSVPIEICMVNKADLMADKAAIEERARENIEKYYMQRLSELESQLAEKTLSADDYEAKIVALEEKYERFEPLLEAMSDRYARTDYAHLDELTQQINTAIEMGDLDEAERLIQSKGDLQKRQEEVLLEQQTIADAERQIAEARQKADKRRRELADDYYHLYTIALSRFQNDSARSYIVARAALDTLNAEYQYQAGQYFYRFVADYAVAENYFCHALRVARSQSGEESADFAVALNELGSLYYAKQQWSDAQNYMQRALSLNTKLWGKEHKTVAENYNNLSAIYYSLKDNKQAVRYAEQALKLATALYGEEHSSVANIQNNIGSIYYQQKKYDKAVEWLQKALNTNRKLYGEQSDKVGIAYFNLAGVYYEQGNMNKAISAVESAKDVFLKVYGTDHPLTKNAASVLTAFKSTKK